MLRKIIALLLCIPSFAFSAEFVAGKDYEVLSGQPEKTSTHTITEFFSYGCPWCYRIEKPLNDWVKAQGKTIRFERVPVVFNQGWEEYAKAYYTAQVLSLSEKFNPLLFKAIQDNKQPLTTSKEMIAFFASHGVDEKIVASAFEHSPTIDLRVKKGSNLMVSYQIKGVPAFVVNHHYKTDIQMAQGPERLFKVLDFLLTNPK